VIDLLAYSEDTAERYLDVITGYSVP